MGGLAAQLVAVANQVVARGAPAGACGEPAGVHVQSALVPGEVEGCASAQASRVSTVGEIDLVGVQWPVAVAHVESVGPQWQNAVIQMQEQLHLLHEAVAQRPLHQRPGAPLLQVVRSLWWAAVKGLVWRVVGGKT